MTIRELQEKAHAMSREKGWYDGENADRNIGEMLALIHSEVSEALEAWRDGDLAIRIRESDGKPEGLGVELADAAIRIGDLCQYLGIDLTECLRVKMAFNATRPYRHGGKLA